MPRPTNFRRPTSRRLLPTALLAIFLTLLASSPARAQQDYVSRYNLYGGYTFLDSPRLGLFENGFHAQAGVNPRTWLSLGFDYSVAEGSMTLTPNLLTTSWQQTLGAALAGLAEEGALPPGYTLAVPTNSLTQTFAGGPQFAYRHLRRVTLFVRPSLGAIHETATPQPTDAIAKAVVAMLAPTGKKTDTTIFYGFGGGVDFIISKHLALRVQVDEVYNHLFSDLLQDGRWTTRFSVGPSFSLGKNIAPIWGIH